MKTLPDYLQEDLHYISIGLNPSPISVKAQYYYGNPRNRFWKALNGSRLVNHEIQPGERAMHQLLEKYRIGFTDIVKRPTPMGNALRAADFRKGAVELKAKLIRYQPEIAWFHGMVTWKNYLKYAEGITPLSAWGAQKHQMGKTRVFVVPNPSPANAHFSLENLIGYYNQMVSYRNNEWSGETGNTDKNQS
jgi:TDG/mug DNA glycosylase family protein